MASDSEIGRVVGVDTAQVTIELNAELRGLTRTTYEGAQDIGRINSYVILPVGARRLVAMVTRVVLAQEAEVSADRTMVTLPSARRIMKATLVGTIDGNSFSQGVALFPVLDNPVHLLEAADRSVIFDLPSEATPSAPDPDDPGYIVRLGESAVFEDTPIHIDPDALFGKHAAVLGSTGCGKSCTIASLIQAILERPEIQRTNIVIFDTNGEYRSAFGAAEQVAESNRTRPLYIPSDPMEPRNRLMIPYWFMNADDFVRLFRASQGVQRPVLLESLRLARNAATSKDARGVLREELLRELNRIWSLSSRDEKTSKDVRDLASGLCSRLGSSDVDDGWSLLGLEKAAVISAVRLIEAEARKHVENNTYPKILPADARKVIRDTIDPICGHLTKSALVGSERAGDVSADSPSFFDKQQFRGRHIEQVLRREESGGARARDFSGTMLLRIDRLLEDSRFDFLLGPAESGMPNGRDVLATFLRDVLGLPSDDREGAALSAEGVVPRGGLPFYDRQRDGTTGHNVVVVDLSLLASEVMENVTALLGRLILEFLQRLGEVGIDARGSLPVVLVLEEAQNYIREQRFGDEPSISKDVFERIAREGRKYGLGLVVSSQRPSELSKTVLSQCSSFIVHRLQNPEDLRYFKEIVPGIFGPLLDQVPALARQTALVLGECVRAPCLVRIRDARPTPRSRDPRFYANWVRENPSDVPVEAVCERWEKGDSRSVADRSA